MNLVCNCVKLATSATCISLFPLQLVWELKAETCEDIINVWHWLIKWVAATPLDGYMNLVSNYWTCHFRHFYFWTSLTIRVRELKADTCGDIITVTPAYRVTNQRTLLQVNWTHIKPNQPHHFAHFNMHSSSPNIVVGLEMVRSGAVTHVAGSLDELVVRLCSVVMSCC